MQAVSGAMEQYLAASEFIDCLHPEITAQAHTLSQPYASKEEVARACFVFVRDEIRHSLDYQLDPVTCRASDVLKYKTGYCYAKSHLLAALLRANNIPAGLCYQRLAMDSGDFALHGLNAVYLDQYGWFRVDARGNKPGLTTEFDAVNESLAYQPSVDGEINLPEIWPQPLQIVTQALTAGRNYQQVADNLPDVALIK